MVKLCQKIRESVGKEKIRKNCVAKENHAKFTSPRESLHPHVTYASHQANSKM